MDELAWLWQRADERGPADAMPREAYRVPRTPVTVIYELAGRQYAWDGVFAGYDGIGLDDKTRTVPCRILVDEPQQVRQLGESCEAAGGPRALLRGMYVTVQIHARPTAEMLRVPEEALRPGSTVWVVRDGRLAIDTVTVAQFITDAALIEADLDGGIRLGESIVTSPLSNVHDGMPVRVQSET
jgi:hypothetical protein